MPRNNWNNKSNNWAPPMRTQPRSSGHVSTEETPLEREQKETIQMLQRNFRVQRKANDDLQIQKSDLLKALKARDSEIELLRSQLLQNKGVSKDHGELLLKCSEQQEKQTLIKQLQEVKREADTQRQIKTDLIHTLKQKDCEIQDLQRKNHQLLEDKTAIIEFGQQLLKQREQEMADTVSRAAFQVKAYIEDLQVQLNTLREFSSDQLYLKQKYEQELEENKAVIQSLQKQLKIQKQSHNQQELESAYSTIQELEDTLKEKNYALEMLHLELNKAFDDKATIECLKQEVEKLKVKVESANTVIKEKEIHEENLNRTMAQVKVENQHLESQLQEAKVTNEKVKDLQMRLEELEEERKNSALETERNKASQDETIQHLKENVKSLETKFHSYEKDVQNQRSELELALTEQKQKVAEATEKAQNLQQSLQEERTNNQDLTSKITSQKSSFEEILQRYYVSYGNLTDKVKKEEQKVKELSAALNSCEKDKTSALSKCEELQNKAVELQATLEQKQQKKQRRWFKRWH